MKPLAQPLSYGLLGCDWWGVNDVGVREERWCGVHPVGVREGEQLNWCNVHCAIEEG
jgi:hypothetical protein